jgi:hypothetical protein
VFGGGVGVDVAVAGTGVLVGAIVGVSVAVGVAVLVEVAVGVGVCAWQSSVKPPALSVRVQSYCAEAMPPQNVSMVAMSTAANGLLIQSAPANIGMSV